MYERKRRVDDAVNLAESFVDSYFSLYYDSIKTHSHIARMMPRYFSTFFFFISLFVSFPIFLVMTTLNSFKILASCSLNKWEATNFCKCAISPSKHGQISDKSHYLQAYVLGPLML